VSATPAVRPPALQHLVALRDPDASPLVVLVAAGHVLRRSRAIAVDEDAAREALGADGLVARALGRVKAEDVRGALDSARLDACAARVQRGAEEAFEAAFPEQEEERAMWSAAALEGLGDRDALQSVLVAATRASQLRAEEAGAPIAAVVADAKDRLALLDATLTPLMRSFVSINPLRRAERETLDDEERGAAFWYTSRVECDGLLEWLAEDGTKDAEHARTCPECRADLSRATLPDRTRHLGERDLERLESGLSTADEAAWIRRHAHRCAPCAEALALSEGLDVEQVEPTPQP
jgi:hypothetical protein